MKGGKETPMLNPCDADFVAHLSAQVPEGTLSAPEPRHLEEPRGRWTGQACWRGPGRRQRWRRSFGVARRVV
jgi:hypothetical protein